MRPHYHLFNRHSCSWIHLLLVETALFVLTVQLLSTLAKAVRQLLRPQPISSSQRWGFFDQIPESGFWIAAETVSGMAAQWTPVFLRSVNRETCRQRGE